MKLYHPVSELKAAAILECGFVDESWTYAHIGEATGVFLADKPLPMVLGAHAACLEIDIAEELLKPCDWFDAEHDSRQWIVSAALLNTSAAVRGLSAEELLIYRRQGSVSDADLWPGR